MPSQTSEKIEDLLKENKISASEYELILQLLGREPNEIELAMFGAMWSEHCAYKNSKPLLRLFPNSSQKTKVLAGQGENAGIIDLGDDIKVAFKIESHNRPTAVEPFQGATTGVGGILRDILTLGARPIAFFNSLHFGPQEDEHSHYLLSHAVSGIAHYGNCTGIPTVGGQVVIDESYRTNPLVNAMCIGLLETDAPITAAAQGIGNPLVYVGSETGRDGLGGASFASAGLSSKSNKDRPAVQVGDPFLGKLLIEACLEAFKTGWVVASQDMGAAGLTCACCEMSAKGEVGVDLHLDLVPTRGKLKPKEYLISESQERMLFVAHKGTEDKLIELFKKWNLNAAVVGEVTNSQLVRIYHNGEKVVELPPKALTDHAPVYTRKAQAPKITVNIVGKPDLEINKKVIERLLLEKLASDNLCSRSWIYSQFDQQVQLNTVFKPGQADAALLRLRKPNGELTNKGLAATLDCNPFYIKHNPYLGAQIAVAEASRNLACVGARALAVTDNLNFGNPEEPESFWYLQEAVKGIIEGCKHFDLPVVSGNVSLYNQFLLPDNTSKGEILPTPVIGMIGVIDDYRMAKSISFMNEGDVIWLAGETQNETDCPKLDWNKEKALQKFLIENINNGKINSCHDLSEGGLLVALAESVMVSEFGAKVELEKAPENLRLDSLLFGETQSRAVFTAHPEVDFHNVEHLKLQKIGYVQNDKHLKVSLKDNFEALSLSRDILIDAHKVGL